jgi:PAS domain S-box-containing protein
MKMMETAAKSIDVQSVLNALPGSCLVLLPDAPQFTIVGVTENYLADTYLKREDIIGRGVFEALTDDPGNPIATGVKNLTASLHHVLEHKKEHGMADQRYDILNPDTGKWEYRIWRPLNKPVPDAAGNVQCIIHWVEDVTEKTRLETQAKLATEKLAESEARFRNMIEQAPVAITLTRGQDLVIESINAPMLKLMNKPPGENVIGKKMADVLPELKGQPALQRVLEVQATGKPFKGNELPVDLMTGGKLERRYFNFSYTVVVEPDATAAVLHVAVDVTEQVEARRKLVESEERFRLMADISPNLVWMLNPDGSYKYINQTSLDYLGITQEEIAAKGWESYLHPDDLKRVSQTITKAMRAGKTYSCEHRLRTKSGAYRWVFSQAVPAYSADGTIYAYIGAGVDIHDRRRAREKLETSEAELQARVIERTKDLSQANEALRQSNLELNRSNGQLEEFAHAATHDLKEPIRKIRVFTGQLKTKVGQRLSEEEQRLLDRIENASERMGLLVDDLLLYSQVSIRPHAKEEVDLNKKVGRVLEDLELDIQEKGAVIHADPLPVVQGNARQLQQLFQNLISNALKYSKAGVPPQIDITAGICEEGGKQYHLIRVRDNGIGFHEEYTEKIFQMFTRLHGKGEYSGTGVGLSIVKKVVENHDGFIKVRSEYGEGSSFAVYLPID